ncbi:MAG: 2-oxoglutarate dehydrogenase E1 component, partial [Spirochaetota bacterium]
CADENMQVCYPTTPAQYFHVLRRQITQNFRKPLVLMTPKSLLRHKACVSATDDLAGGTYETVLDDPSPAAKTENLLICAGKVYYDLAERREELGDERTSIVRLEQFYPFDRARFAEVIAKYPHARNIRWIQEEAQNHGGWSFVRDRVSEHLGGRTLEYVGRAPCPSPSTGSHRQHKEELERFLEAAFS